MSSQTTSLDQIRENLRLQEVYNTISRYALDSVLDRGPLGIFQRRMQEFIYQPGQSIPPLSAPVKLRLMLQDLGPTYVKMGQIVSSRAESLPDDWADELNKLQSNVPPFPSDEVREIIIEELGAPPEQIYEEFAPEPFAAASTAQVHRARLKDGSDVVVKVQRPNIRKQVKADIGVMHNLSVVVERRSSQARDLNLTGMIDEFGAGIIRELDYGGELYNMKRLSRNMADIPNVTVPKAFGELSTSKVLTMEFFKGVKISNAEAIEAAGLDKEFIGLNVLRALIKQLLIDGFFHADPHPGNVLVNLDTGMVGFLDMGLMGEISVTDRVNLVNLLMVTRQKDPAGLARAVRNVSVPFRKNVDDAAFYKDFERAIGRYMDPDQPSSFGGLMNVVFGLLADHGLQLNTELTLAVKAMMQAEAIYDALHPGGGGLAEVGFDMTVDLLKQETTATTVRDGLNKQASLLLQSVAKELPGLQTAGLSWLRQYRKGRFEVFVDTSDLSKQVKSLRRIAHQAIAGILLVGMIIGSAIAASFSSVSGSLEVLTSWALVAYFVSMAVAVIFVFIVLYKLIFNKYKDEDDE